MGGWGYFIQRGVSNYIAGEWEGRSLYRVRGNALLHSKGGGGGYFIQRGG